MTNLAQRLTVMLGVAASLLAPWRIAPAAAATDGAPDELQPILVSVTRAPQLIGDAPVRVEAVPAGEIEENLTVQPGNLTSLLHELPSVHLPAVGGALGGVGLQLRGLPTRDTLILTDGLPLLGIGPNAFGLLQTPPLDLERVEVIQGAASALYGGSALAGVVNLVSRRPEAPSAVLGNATSQDAGDLMGFFTHRDPSPWSATLTAAADDQSRRSTSGDGWADIPGYRRYSLQPRVWWNGPANASLFVTAGLLDEYRVGGTLDGAVLPGGGPFPEALRTHGAELGAVAELSPEPSLTVVGRLSATTLRLDRTFGFERTASTANAVFAESTLGSRGGPDHWLIGAAFEQTELAVPGVPGVGYTHSVPGVFAAADTALAAWATVSSQVRIDDTASYGTFVSPRLSTLLRAPQSPFSLRASVGAGYSLPTPLLDEVEDTDVSTVLPLRALRAERAVTAALDARWASGPWDLNVSGFTAEIRSPFEVLPQGDRFAIINAPGPERAPGAEVLAGYVSGPLHALASWSTIDATHAPPTGPRAAVPLVPHTAGTLDAILEDEDRGRVGLEFDYTGPQGLEADPYRTSSPAYVTLNALAELRLRRVALFFNAINLTDVRQSHWAPLVRSAPGPGGNPITPIWAPLAGRTFNVGFRTR